MLSDKERLYDRGCSTEFNTIFSVFYCCYILNVSTEYSCNIMFLNTAAYIVDAGFNSFKFQCLIVCLLLQPQKYHTYFVMTIFVLFKRHVLVIYILLRTMPRENQGLSFKLSENARGSFKNLNVKLVTIATPSLIT